MLRLIPCSAVALAAIAMIGSAGATLPADIKDGVEFTTGSGGTVIANFLKNPRHFEFSMTWRGKKISAVGLELSKDGLYFGFGEPATECVIHLRENNIKIGASADVVCVELYSHAFITDRWTIASMRNNGVDVPAGK